MLEIPKKEYLAQVVNFPRQYHLYKQGKVSFDHVRVPEGWEKGLQEINAELGRRKQLDLHVYFTSIQDPDFSHAIESRWLFGPKNSMTIVMGVSGDKIQWVRVVTISEVEDLKVALRDSLEGRSVADVAGNLEIIRREVRHRFHRTPMENWEYLSSAATPSVGVLLFLYALVAAISVGLGIFAHQEDIF